MNEENLSFKGCFFDKEEMLANGHSRLIKYDNNTAMYQNDDDQQRLLKRKK